MISHNKKKNMSTSRQKPTIRTQHLMYSIWWPD